MDQFQKYLVCFLFFAAFANTSLAQITTNNRDSIPLVYDFSHLQTGNMRLGYPSKIEVIFDKILNKFFLEKVGDYFIKTPIYMTPEEYDKYRLRRDMLEYFKSKVAAQKSKKTKSFSVPFCVFIFVLLTANFCFVKCVPSNSHSFIQ